MISSGMSLDSVGEYFKVIIPFTTEDDPIQLERSIREIISESLSFMVCSASK